MLKPAPAPAPPRAHAALATLLERHTGQQLSAARNWRIETALKPLMRDEGWETLDDVVTALTSRDPFLVDRIVGELVNKESSFFRDAPVFGAIEEAIVALAADHPGRRPRIWSAGCSHGQEPLSLAMIFAERAAGDGGIAPDILATDISHTALARARQGRFTQFEIQRGLPVRRMVRWFTGDGDDWVAAPDLLRHIQFRPLNLVSDPMPAGRFDMILCRNVLLYFPLDVRRRVLDLLALVLRPGGLLVLGAGETVIGQTDLFQPSPRYRGFYEPISPGVRAAA